MKNHNIVLESINIIKVDIQDLPHDPPTPLWEVCQKEMK
jgi:hypothetical protein